MHKKNSHHEVMTVMIKIRYGKVNKLTQFLDIFSQFRLQV